MSVEFGVGSAENWSMSERPTAVGAGDRLVFANVYDTYAAHLFDYCKGILRDPAAAANAVQDTLIAADNLVGKLRDHEQLPVWLYCLARLQCMSERGQRSETTAADDSGADYDFGEEYFDGPGTADAEPEIADDGADGPDGETLLVVRAAFDGLTGRDREVLSLAFRHGVDNAGIGVTLGVSTGRARALVSGASTRFEKSAAVVAMLSRGWASCPVLEGMVGSWNPASSRLTPHLLDRLIRHIGSCGNCSQRRGYTVFRPDLLGAVPLAIPPAELRFRITSTAADPAAESYRRKVVHRIGNLYEDGFPMQAVQRHSLPVVLAASLAVLVVLIAGGALLYKLTFAAPAALSAATGAAAGPSSTSAASSAPSSGHARKSRAPRHVLAPLPALFGPSPAPAGVPPVPLPHPSKHSPSPRPTHSRSPSPSPSPSRHTATPTPTPTPTPTTPTPTPTTPTPTPTTPTPTPTTPTPLP
jgi:DNA-directed RNA polymerase specialized sigma24 family protein